MPKKWIAVVAAGAFAFVGAGIVLTASPGQAGEVVARASLRLADQRKVGNVEIRQGDANRVTVHVQLPADVAGSYPARFHGFHLHANGDPTNGSGCVADASQPASTWFVSADGHYNPAAGTHGNHAGDMPPLVFASGNRASASFLIDNGSVAGLIGRAVIIHAKPDNLNHIPQAGGPEDYTANSPAAIDKTAKTGNAGDRIICGVIRAD